MTEPWRRLRRWRWIWGFWTGRREMAGGFRERKEREVALKRRCVPDSAAGAAVSCPAVQTARMGWLGRQRRDLVAKKHGA